MVQAVPEGFHTITPDLLVEDLSAQLEFLKRAFDAVEQERLELPDGSIKNARVLVGDLPVMMGSALRATQLSAGTIPLSVAAASGCAPRCFLIDAR